MINIKKTINSVKIPMFLLTLISVCLAPGQFAHLHPDITTYFVTTKLH